MTQRKKVLLLMGIAAFAVCIGLLAVFFCYFVVYPEFIWSSEKVAESQAHGDVIVKALRQFHKDYGHYPDQLEELVPAYLSEVRPPTAGNKTWQYSLKEDGSHFCLAFAVDGDYPICYFDSSVGHWYRDQ